VIRGSSYLSFCIELIPDIGKSFRCRKNTETSAENIGGILIFRVEDNLRDTIVQQRSNLDLRFWKHDLI
jgi:hypothetical protein